VGWSTWCTNGPCFQDVCTQDEVKSVVSAMAASGLQAAGWDWISFDDVSQATPIASAGGSSNPIRTPQCWEADERDSDGNLQADPSRFPDGMPAMVDFIHAANFSVQIYTSLGRSTCSRSGRPLPLPGSYGHESQVRYAPTGYHASNEFAAMTAGCGLVCQDWRGWNERRLVQRFWPLAPKRHRHDGSCDQCDGPSLVVG